MKKTEKKSEVREIISQWKRRGLSVGLVPTMGYLHQGHEGLIRRAALENDRVVVSVFVNPLQFDRDEDLKAYPRDLEGDEEKIGRSGGDLVYSPDPGGIYPEGFKSIVEVGGLDRELCGRTRPGHFRGVCTVVNKLFNIVQPDRAYFGEKDYQQLAIIKRMTEDLDIPVEIVGCPIVREESGLAMSSRNARLSEKEREDAAQINRILIRLGKRIAEDRGKIEQWKKGAGDELRGIPGARVDYLEVVDSLTLERAGAAGGELLAATAVFIGGVRLIDNVIIGGEDNET